MGCTPSKPAPLDHSKPIAIENGGPKPSLLGSNSGKTNGTMDSSKTRTTKMTTTGGTGSSKANNSHSSRKMSSPRSSKVRGVESPSSSTAGASDPRWIQLWKSHQPLLLDPADVHAAIDDCMARTTNKLSATEITFLQRKVRGIVRSFTQQESKTRIRLKANSTASQEQETKVVAEKYHLLSNHVLKKVLPTSPTFHSTFLLLSYCHDSLWDRVAEIAAQSCETAGLVMDVNKYKPLSTVPSPCSQTVEPSGVTPPPGVSLHSLTFMIGLALRK